MEPTKITITLDPDFFLEVQEYARSRGLSLTQLVEESLEERLKNDESFVQRWKEAVEPARQEANRYRRLVRRYLKRSGLKD
jgi:predicted DNA-binding ribbon-helix-helix protein